jgi:hypothetical protein
LDLDRVASLHWGETQDDPPAILQGWRGRLVGEDLHRLLDGEIVLGVDLEICLPEVARRARNGAGD